MALKVEIPTLIRIREGIKVNVSLVVSLAVERNKIQKKLKDEISKQVSDGSLKRTLAEDDYVETGEADVISFWFIGGSSLSYRVGNEIEQEDFDRIHAQLETIEYKSDRKPSPDKTVKTA